MAWIVEFDPSVEKELDKLHPQQAKRILKFFPYHLKRQRNHISRMPLDAALEFPFQHEG